MTLRLLPSAGAVLLTVFGVWAGARLHASRTASRGPVAVAALRVPAGEASAPNPSDLAAGFDIASATPRQIPEKLPNFTLSDRTGKSTPIGTWNGKSLVLNFWATWCAPCKREIPLLKDLAGAWSARGFQVVGVAVDDRAKVAAFADQLKIPYPVLVGEQDALDVAASLGMESPVFPFTVFTDAHGRVVALFVGELHPAQADLILGEVEKVNTGGANVAQAREFIAERLQALNPKSSG